MPAYDRYSDVADYLMRRLKDLGTNAYQLSLRLGKSRGYIHQIVHRTITPSRKMCALISQELGDDPRVLRILAGYETPPAEPATVALARNIAALSAKDRGVVERIVEALGKSGKGKGARSHKR